MKLTKLNRQAFINAALDDVPTIDYTTAIIDSATKFAVSLLPEIAQTVFAKHPELIATDNSYIRGRYICLPGRNIKFTDAQKVHLAELETKSKAQDNALSELRTKLSGVVGSVNTVKALKVLLPEYAKYMPDETHVTVNLPAIANVVADFVKAGWPDKLTVAAA